MDLKTLRFTPTHEWVHVQGDEATIGISKFAVDQLTDLIMIELPAVGTRLTGGKTFGEIESVKAVSDLYAPISGEVIAVNKDVAANVQLLAEDPYEKGWLIKIKVDPAGRHVQLMDLDAYEQRVCRRRALTTAEGSSSSRNTIPAGHHFFERNRNRQLMAYIANTPDDVRIMLGAIGLASVEQLFDAIPRGISGSDGRWRSPLPCPSWS